MTPLPPYRLRDLPPPPPGNHGWPWTKRYRLLPPTMPDGRPWPVLGIVTPSYNQGAFLEKTIRSVLLQGYPNLEFIIEDGGSTDTSRAILEKYAPLVTHCISEKDRGQSHAINKGMARLEKAEWVTWLNSDDIFLPGALRSVGEWVAKDQDAVALVGRGFHYILKKNKRVAAKRRGDLDNVNVRNWMRSSFLQPACFFSKAAFDEIGGVNESLHYAMDFELWVKLGERGRFDLIDTYLAQDLWHEDAKTQLAMGKYYAETAEVLFKLGYVEEARQMIADMYNEWKYLASITSRLTDSAFYQNWVQPIARRFLGAPEHLQRAHPPGSEK